MCSIQQEDDSTSVPDILTADHTAESEVCTKCALPAVIALRKDDVYCRNCFMVRATHKFRCEFGKSRLIRDHERVLVAYSAGKCSCAMIHLIQEGLSNRAHKKLRFIPELVFIDDDCGHGSSESCERQKFLFDVLNRLQETGLKYYIFTLEQAFDEDFSPIFSNFKDESNRENEHAVAMMMSSDKTRIRMLMESTKTETSREILISVLRRRLLVSIARRMNCGKVVMGDNASCLASHMLSSIVQGRGCQIPWEMGFSDDRHGDVIFVRPLREFTEKEIEVFNSIAGISSFTALKVGNGMTSMESLSRKFVLGLQAEHGSTLGIICRTGEKLEMPDGEMLKKFDKCALCQTPIDNVQSGTEASAVGAIEFSRSIFRLLQEKSKTDDVLSNTGTTPETFSLEKLKNGYSCASKPESFTLDPMSHSLCYGCKLTVRDMTDVEKLPSSILQEAKKKTERDQVRHQIEQFLLEDPST